MKQQAKTVGISQRAYAEQIGVHHSYVAKMIRRGAIPVLSDGSIDPEAADAARAKFTRVGRGQRRWKRRHPAQPVAVAVNPPTSGSKATPICQGCGARYLRKYRISSPTPDRFCSASCEQDFNDGLSLREIANRRDRALSPKKIKWGKPEPTPKPTREPEPPPILATCCGCLGLFNVRSARREGGPNFDPTRHCSQSCEEMLNGGMRPDEIRRHWKTWYAEEQCYTRAQINSPSFFDWCKPDGSPNP
jgi:hypothetical protein